MENKQKYNSYVKTVSDEMGESYEEALELMNVIKEKYTLTYSDIAVNKLWKYEGPVLDSQAAQVIEKKQRKHDYAIKKIMESTGWTREYTVSETERIKEKFNLSARTYWLRELYTKTDEEILEYKQNSKSAKEAKIQKIMDITGWTKEKVEEHMAYCNANFGVHSIEYYSNFKCWDLTDEQLENFAVDEDSRKLSKIYNKKPVVLNNKLRFNKTFSDYLGRKFWTNRNTSFEEFKAFTEGLDKIFCKPLNLSMGVGTKIVNTAVSDEELKVIYEDLIADNELLAEEFIIQHEKMNEVYSGCVNTVRFTMLRDNNECHKLWSFVRFGSNGIVDNFHGGGMAAAVDVETGIIISDAMNSEGKYFQNHPVSGVQFKGFQIPHWDKVITITEQAMKSQNFVNYVGWDIAICPDKVVIVEGNATPQVGVYQAILAPTQEGQKSLYERFLKVRPASSDQKKTKEKIVSKSNKANEKKTLISRVKRKIKKMFHQ